MHMQPRHLSLAHATQTGPGRRALFLLPGIALFPSVVLPAHADDEFLPPEQAFRFSAKPHDAKSVEVSFAIAPGYYLYREQFKFAANGATLGAPVIPPGKVKYDVTFEKNVETYRDAITILVPVE